MQVCKYLNFQIITLLTFITFICSCNVGSKYDPPEVPVPEEWKNKSTTCEPCYTDYWWEVFDDPVLNELELGAIEYNHDLESAFQRVLEARSLMKEAEAELYPQLYLNPSYKNEGVLYESYSDGTIVRSHQVLYLLPFSLSYETDLWGKYKNRYYAAKENWEAELDAYDAIMLILTSDLATVYFQLRTLDSQLDLLALTIENREKSLRINRNRFKNKIIDYVDVTRAGLELSKAKTDYRELKRLRAELENRLAVLSGYLPSEFCFEHHPLQGTPPEIPAGIPSDLLLRRPDLAEAERKVASEHSLVNSAYASFFPSISLTAAAGYSSPHLRYFLKSKGRLWSFGASGSQMIYDAGRLQADLEYQEARFREANEEYQQRVLVSFEEVEDALSNLENYAQQYADVSESVDWAMTTNRINNKRFSNGVTSYLDVVISEQEELQSQFIQSNIQGLRFVATVQLIKALGGCW